VPFIKISSMEISNHRYLEYIARKNIPIIISTGMSEMSEIEKAIKVLESTGNRNIIILHCVSIYPTPTEKVNLNNIVGLRERFSDYPIGFSDHTLGDLAAVSATVLGAAVIEKHITLDAKRIGMDNQMAMEPEGLKELVRKCCEVRELLGTKDRAVTDDEYKQRDNMRRSIVTTRYLSAGHVLTAKDMDVKRPGNGIPPEKLEMLIGMTLKNDIEADSLIMESDLDK